MPEWSRTALRDLAEALEYIAADDPDAARRMARRIHQAVAPLNVLPLIGRKGFVEGTREIVVPPYTIVYQVVEGRACIARIIHGARLRTADDV